jgi:predicted nucleotidyltransferase
MPVRSLTSSVLRWPDAAEVIAALRAWAARVTGTRPEVCRIGYFGSYARGDWGVGSDLDVVILVDRCDLPFERRATVWDLDVLPVPVDVLVYTEDEWDRLGREGRSPRMTREAIWVYAA